MLDKIKNNQTLKMLFDSHNVGLYILVIIALSITWSSVKVIQKNYGLEKQITQLQQQVDVLDQQNKNQKLENQYYKTDAFLDLAARKYFGKASPSEKLILVPSEVSQKYVHSGIQVTAGSKSTKSKPKFVQNWQDWINFFLHRQQS